MDQNIQSIILINNARKNYSAYLNFDAIFEFIGREDAYIIFHKGVDHHTAVCRIDKYLCQSHESHWAYYDCEHAFTNYFPAVTLFG